MEEEEPQVKLAPPSEPLQETIEKTKNDQRIKDIADMDVVEKANSDESNENRVVVQSPAPILEQEVEMNADQVIDDAGIQMDVISNSEMRDEEDKVKEKIGKKRSSAFEMKNNEGIASEIDRLKQNMGLSLRNSLNADQYASLPNPLRLRFSLQSKEITSVEIDANISSELTELILELLEEEKSIIVEDGDYDISISLVN